MFRVLLTFVISATLSYSVPVNAKDFNPWRSSDIPLKVENALTKVGLNSIANWTGCGALNIAGDPQNLAEQILSDGWSHLSLPICLDHYFNSNWELNENSVRQKAIAMKQQISALMVKFPDSVFVLIGKSRSVKGGWSRKKKNTSILYEAFEKNETARNSYYRMWEIWSEIFQDIPSDTLVFGIMNEPEFHNVNWFPRDTWAGYAEDIIKKIRLISPERVILFEGIDKSVVGRGKRPDEMSAVLPFKRIVYGFHFYEPYDWTHRKSKGGKEPSQSMLVAAEDTMRAVKAFSKNNKVPVLLSEFGIWGPYPVDYSDLSEIVRGVSFEQRARFASVVYEATVPHGIGITWWAVHDENTPYGGSGGKMQYELKKDPLLWKALRLN